MSELYTDTYTATYGAPVTPGRQAARAGLPGDAGAVNQAAQVNQFLASMGVTAVYQGTRAWSPAEVGGAWYTTLYWLSTSAQSGIGLPTRDVDQPFTLPSGVTAVGRVTVAVLPVGSGAGLQVTLYPDDGSGYPDTASPLASSYLPSSHLTATAAANGLPGGTLATARCNTVLASGWSTLYQWTQPAVSSGGAASYATCLTSGNWTLFLGGVDSSSVSVGDVSSAGYLGSGRVSGVVPQPPLPQAATYLCACACGDTVVAAGGLSGTTAYANVWTATLDAGTGTLGSWTAQAALPQAAVGAAMASWGGSRVYVIGGTPSGTAGTAPTDAVWTGTVSSGQVTGWTAGPPLPAARSAMFAAVIGDWLVVTGGTDTSGTVYTDTWYTAVNTDGSLAGWLPGPDLPQGSMALVPGWNQAVTGSAFIVVSGESSTSPVTASGVCQALTVTADGPAPQWEIQVWPPYVPGDFQVGAYRSGNAGDYTVVGFHQTQYESWTVTPVPLASVPLPASGLTPGSTYHVMLHQDGGDDANYLRLAEMTTANGTWWLYADPGSGGPWTQFADGHQIAVEVYDQTAGGPPLHLWEDSGARVTTLVYSGAPGQLLGAMESTLFPSGSPETALPSVTEVTWDGGMPTGLVQLA